MMMSRESMTFRNVFVICIYYALSRFEKDGNQLLFCFLFLSRMIYHKEDTFDGSNVVLSSFKSKDISITELLVSRAVMDGKY